MTKKSKQTIKDYYESSDFIWQNLDGEIQDRYLISLVPLLEQISGSLSSAGIAVDVGCGGGRYTQLLPQFFEKVVGYDFSEHLVEAGRNAFEEIQFEVADATSLPRGDSSVDFVMSIGLTECLNKVGIEKYFAEMARILVPGGICLFRVWGALTIVCLLAKCGRGIATAYPEFYFYSRKAIRKQLQSAGFQNIRFIGGLLVARWWFSEKILGKLLWTKPVRKCTLFIEQHARYLPIYETYWVIAKK